MKLAKLILTNVSHFGDSLIYLVSIRDGWVGGSVGGSRFFVFRRIFHNLVVGGWVDGWVARWVDNRTIFAGLF